MSNVSTNSVRQLATLSALELDESELQLLTRDLEKILDYVQELDQLDTTGVAPTYQVTGLSNVWRQDKVEESSADAATLLELAPHSQAMQVKVPKVL